MVQRRWLQDTSGEGRDGVSGLVRGNRGGGLAAQKHVACRPPAPQRLLLVPQQGHQVATPQRCGGPTPEQLFQAAGGRHLAVCAAVVCSLLQKPAGIFTCSCRSQHHSQFWPDLGAKMVKHTEKAQSLVEACSLLECAPVWAGWVPHTR